MTQSLNGIVFILHLRCTETPQAKKVKSDLQSRLPDENVLLDVGRILDL